MPLIKKEDRFYSCLVRVYLSVQASAEGPSDPRIILYSGTNSMLEKARFIREKVAGPKIFVSKLNIYHFSVQWLPENFKL